jgi:carbonic anhydrase
MPQTICRPVRRHSLLAHPLGVGVLAAAAALCAAPAAKASDAHAPAAHKAAAAAPAADPMDTLREKLATKLGAVKAPEAPTPYVVRVVSKANAEPAHGSAAAHAESNAKAGGHGSTASRVARLRAAKAAAGQAPSPHAAHWGYAGEGGPEQWGQLKPEFSTCANGSRQSPIDIRSGVKVDLEPIQFDYRPSAFGVIDNGHTNQVNVGGGNAIEVQGRRYDLVQFHFHRPSEERINGRQFDMVAHLVHKDPEGRLAVVAVLLDRGGPAQPLIQTVWNNLPLEKNSEVSVRGDIDVSQLLPADRRYFTYMGSLTTPPCSEGVLWMVLQQPVLLAQNQIGVFSRLYPMNARPVQQASGRLIKQSN